MGKLVRCVSNSSGSIIRFEFTTVNGEIDRNQSVMVEMICFGGGATTLKDIIHGKLSVSQAESEIDWYSKQTSCYIFPEFIIH